MNYKNQLQEYCHMLRIPLPSYTSHMTGNSNNPLWSSTVVFQDQSFTSGEYRSKKDAEQQAAKLALSQTNQKKNVLFLDLENIQPDISKLSRTYEIHAFVSTFTTVDLSKYSTYAQIHIIDTGLADAADHFLTYTIGYMIGSKKLDQNCSIVIMSRDKALAVVEKILLNEGFAVRHVKAADF